MRRRCLTIRGASWRRADVRSRQEYAFTFFELAMLPTDAITAWKNAQADDRARAGLSLVAQLYMQRFPYEEPPQGKQ